MKDRLAHEVVYNALKMIFERKFIFHSLSCRLGKGTHLGVNLLEQMIQKVSANGRRPCFALKMDISRFFDSISHPILKTLIEKTIRDEKALIIIDKIIDSFHRGTGWFGNIGIPLGNVTSQLFANIYLHELDDFIKQQLREKWYVRYCDDFVILSNDDRHLQSLIITIGEFLWDHLRLVLHPKKVVIRKLEQGVDFVGYVLFQHHQLVRTRTKQRMKKRLKGAYEGYLNESIELDSMDQKLQSSLGILSHANQHTLSQALTNAYWVRTEK